MMIMIRILQETVDAALPTESIVEIYDPAEPNDDPVRPKIVLNIALGVVVGLIVGVGLAFFIEYLDTSDGRFLFKHRKQKRAPLA